VIEPYQKRQITLGFRVYDVAGLSGHLELVPEGMVELIDLGNDIPPTKFEWTAAFPVKNQFVPAGTS
jgi:hypothetical protein